MKKILNKIKTFYQQDPEGFYGSVAIYVLIYILLFHLIPMVK